MKITPRKPWICAIALFLSLILPSVALAGVEILSPLEGQTVSGIVPIPVRYEGTINLPVYYLLFWLDYNNWSYRIEEVFIEPYALSGSYTFYWDTTFVPSRLPDGAQVRINVQAAWAGYEYGAIDRVTVTVNNSPPLNVEVAKQIPPDKVTAVAEPINVVNGNMFISQTDLFIPGREIALELLRTYNSQDDFNGSFGYGWRSNFDITLTEQPDESVIEVDGKGVYTLYAKNLDGTYRPSAGKYSLLTKNPDGTFTLLSKHGRKLYFDSQGRLIKIEERNANFINILRDNAGVILEVSDSSGRKLLFHQDAQNRIAEVQDPLGMIFKYEYDSDGNLIKTIGPLNNETLYAYDANHNLIRQTNANNSSLSFEYDSSDRTYRSWQDNGNNEVNLVFDPANKTTTSTDSLGNATRYAYNEYGLVTRITDSQNNIQASVWDGNLNKISSTDAGGNTTTFSYDTKSNLLSLKDPLNTTTTFTYEPDFNLLSSITNALGNKTEYFYDRKGNLMQVKDALGNTSVYFYDELGQPLQTQNPNNSITGFGYDAYGNLTQITDAAGNIASFTYDIIGNPIWITDAQGNSTNFSYDLLNQLTQITYPDNSKVTYAYDAVGNLISFTDANGNLTTYTYDIVNRPIQVTDALSNITQYNYDTEGNRLSIIDANANTTQYQYDTLNRLSKTIDPLNNQAIFNYGPNDNLISKTDANGNMLNYAYDKNNRLVRINYPDTSIVSFTYDALGRRTSITDTRGTTIYSYDALGRLIQVDGPQNNDTISYAYDKVGSRIQMTNQDGGITNYTYDNLNRLISLTDPESKTTVYNYDSLNNLTQMVYPNNTKTYYVFDNLKRLVSLTNKIDTDTISSYTYDYNPSGMRTKVTLANNDYILYSYDALNRLTQEQRYNLDNELLYALKYTYDAVGNRLTQEIDLRKRDLEIQGFPQKATLEYAHNSDNQLRQLRINNLALKSPSRQSKTIHYTYDQNGNLIQEASIGRDSQLKIEKTYTYDYENRPTQIKIIDTKTQTFNFAYDGLGRRISQNQSHLYFYDGLNIIIERDQNHQTLATYTRGLSYGGGIGSIIGEKEQELYYHYDGIGSVTGLTDTRAYPKITYTYDAFGNILKQKGLQGTNPYTFSTKEQDESGLIYFGARYYEPKVGRFITKDPLGFREGVNLYRYCLNNPTNLIDPLGLWVAIGERAMGPGSHTVIILHPDNELDFKNNKSIPWYKNRKGEREATLSAGPNLRPNLDSPWGNLTAHPSSKSDRPSNLRNIQRIIDPLRRSDTQLIKAIINSASKYQNNFPYDPVPSTEDPSGPQPYNSNSYTIGILNDVGISNPPNLPEPQPGWDIPIPLGGE